MSATDCIIKVLESAKRPLYLHEIRAQIVRRYGEHHSEAAISARIRDQVRHRLAADRIAVVGMPQKGKQAWRYWLCKF